MVDPPKLPGACIVVCRIVFGSVYGVIDAPVKSVGVRCTLADAAAALAANIPKLLVSLLNCKPPAPPEILEGSMMFTASSLETSKEDADDIYSAAFLASTVN